MLACSPRAGQWTLRTPVMPPSRTSPKPAVSCRGGSGRVGDCLGDLHRLDEAAARLAGLKLDLVAAGSPLLSMAPNQSPCASPGQTRSARASSAASSAAVAASVRAPLPLRLSTARSTQPTSGANEQCCVRLPSGCRRPTVDARLGENVTCVADRNAVPHNGTALWQRGAVWFRGNSYRGCHVGIRADAHRPGPVTLISRHAEDGRSMTQSCEGQIACEVEV